MTRHGTGIVRRRHREIHQQSRYGAIRGVGLQCRQTTGSGSSKCSSGTLTVEVGVFIGAENEQLILDDGTTDGAAKAIIVKGLLVGKCMLHMDRIFREIIQ